MRHATHRLIQPVVVLGVFGLDRLTKYWAKAWLEPVYSVKLLPFFHLTYVENTGAAWGMLHRQNTLLIFVTVGLLAALLYLRRTWPERSLWTHYGLMLVAGGALGNLYDRIVYGCVVDFFDFIVWPVFNVADSAITVGACLLAWGLHAAKKKDEARVSS